MTGGLMVCFIGLRVCRSILLPASRYIWDTCFLFVCLTSLSPVGPFEIHDSLVCNSLSSGTIGFLTSYWVVRSLLDITLYLSNWTGRLFSAPCYDVGWSLESQASGVTESKHGQSDPTDQACICPQTQPPSYESVRSGST
jgi:hypothetical protein